jgi:hypothetical protein
MLDRELINHPAIKNASPRVRRWLTALLLHGEWAGSDPAPKDHAARSRRRKREKTTAGA